MGGLAYQQVALELAGRRLMRLRVEGQSMLPFLRPGEYLLAQAVEGGLPAAGDLIVFRQAGVAVTHRVVRVSPGGVTLKGDNARRLDAPVRESDLVGRVQFVERDGVRLAWRPGWGDRLAARLSLWEGLVYEGLIPLGKEVFPRWRRALAFALALPFRGGLRLCSYRLRLKYRT
jgi:hypothetical protein